MSRTYFQNLKIGYGNFPLTSAVALMAKHSLTRKSIIDYSAKSCSARLIEQYQPEITKLNSDQVSESSMCQLHKERNKDYWATRCTYPTRTKR